MKTDLPLVDDIRAASRSLVREWGFMGGAFAGTELSPSAVHALIEMEKGGLTARDLAAALRLEKSSVSRMLRKLVEAGDVSEAPGGQDSRLKELTLTPAGKRRVTAIHAHARGQVRRALERLKPTQHASVLKGLQLYTGALAPDAASAAQPLEIVAGYRPGAIARVTQMHALYYARASGFGQRFESLVAAGLAEFCNRLESPRNQLWTARQGGEILGSVAVDGEDLGGDIAHLRWFIVDDEWRGTGAGRKLLATALDFVDANAFAETHLWTFSGLTAARHLYEASGFACAEERAGEQWGKQVLEQRFVRRRP